MRNRSLSLFVLGANPWAKVHQKGRWPASHLGLPSYQISLPCVNPSQKYPWQNILWTNKKWTHTHTQNNKRYISSTPIGMWG